MGSSDLPTHVCGERVPEDGVVGGGGDGGVLFDLRLKVKGWVGVCSAIGEFMAMSGNVFCALIDYGSKSVPCSFILFCILGHFLVNL